MKKVAVITGTRAEYGLLYPLLMELNADPEFELHIIATGMHLSPEFGLTYREIERDGFKIDERVEMLLSSDTEVGIAKSIGLGVIGFADAFFRMNPDLVILLGDRFETFAAAIAAFVARIPIAHLYGGELTQGVIDDAMRHAITKMSVLHFVSTEEYRRRVIQLGEDPRRVFNVGALGIDNIRHSKLLTRDQLEKKLRFEFGQRNALVTFHPVTLEPNTAKEQFEELLKALDCFPDLKVIFTKPNADTGSRVIISLLEEYAKKNPSKSIVFTSMGRLEYLSTLQYVDVVIGNSSSGIIEVPSFGKPTINVGDRQRGRVKAESVLDCNPRKEEILEAMKKAFSPEFKEFCRTVKNPYGEGNAASKIVRLLKEEGEKWLKVKKTFYDFPKGDC